MKVAVNATRMVLLRTKRRTELARRGHKLLKDKLDGLVGKFIGIAKETEKKLSRLNQVVPRAFSNIILAGSEISAQEFEEAVFIPKQGSLIHATHKNIMGVRVPQYELKIEGTPFSYGFANTPAELDRSLIGFNQILPELVSLAANIKALELISKEITKVKRRVNALEHILIPELSSAVSFIKMKLAEMERSYLTSLMKIKDIVRAR